MAASLFSVVAAIAAAVIVEKISDTEAAGAMAAAMGELRVQFTHNGRGLSGDNGGRRQRGGREKSVGWAFQ